MKNGVINLFKPRGMTSFDAVKLCKKLVGEKKIGHGGTLDPMVSGVLPILVGRAAKIESFLHMCPKEYIGEVTLGIETDSLDFTGKSVGWEEVPKLSSEIIERVFESFIGETEQIPPMLSAKRVKGKRLYQYAREGAFVERKPQRIEIYSLKLLNFDLRKILFEVSCSRGTYIRSLCADIAESLSTVGYMSYLFRKSAGGFSVQKSISLERLGELSDSGRIDEAFISVEEALNFLPKLDLGKEHFKTLLNGGKVFCDNVPESPFTLYGGEFLGLGAAKENIVHIDKLLI